jgi:carboxymethylenebutenolidase
MCYDDNARPPLPPGATGAAHGADIVLTAADGNRFAAYVATPQQPATAQVLILPDVRGLHQFYKELALRFAEVGVAAVAMDYFGRSAGLSARDDSFEFMPHVLQLTQTSVMADAAAALAQLRDQTGADLASCSVGFCMGGTLSFLCGTQELGLSGVIGFYAGMSRDFGGSGLLLQWAHKIHLPVLGLFGGNDPVIPADQVAALDQALDTAGVPHEIITYPGAPHSFFDRRSVEFAAESSDAWTRVRAFIAAQAAATTS